jgi:hypothetical protein
MIVIEIGSLLFHHEFNVSMFELCGYALLHSCLNSLCLEIKLMILLHLELNVIRLFLCMKIKGVSK